MLPLNFSSIINIAIMILTHFQSTVDKLIKKTNLALLVGTNSWRDQFVEAITVSSGESLKKKRCQFFH